MSLLQDTDSADRWFSVLAPGYDAVVPTLFWPDSLQREGIARLEIDTGDRVLDIGCGTGETVSHLLSETASVHGLDLSGDQLETAAEKGDLEDAAFVRGDATTLPYADESFDRVVSIGSILYWAEPDEALEEAYRVTKPGGEILVMGFHRRPYSAWNPARNLQNGLSALFFFRYDREEGTELFENAGWEDVDHEVTGPAWSPGLVIATTATKARETDA